MANVHSLSLFKLPTLAYENVIDYLHHKEKFNLSATSKKSTLIVKRYHQLKKHKLMILLWCDGYSARIYVYIDRGDSSNIKKSNSWVYELGGDNNLIVDPMRVQVTHIASIASTASLRLRFNNTHPEVHTTFIPLAEHFNLTLNSVDMNFIARRPDDDWCRWVFENCRFLRTAHSLKYHRETTNRITMDPDTMGSYSFEFLELYETTWLTGNHLIKCFSSCKHIELLNSELSAQEINDFLKNWIKGSNVQSFRLTANNPIIHMGEVLFGIASVFHPHVHDKTFDVVTSSAYVIKNTEGLEAVVHRTHYMFHLSTNFEIVEWNFFLREAPTSDDAEEEDSDGED